MATYNPNGRNATRPDENRPSWRPQDQDRDERPRSFDEDDRNSPGRDDDRFEPARERDLGERGRWGNARDQTERYGQGQSGYGAGRYGDDRAYQSRNQSWYGRDDRDRGIGTDDRFEGRGGAGFGNERSPERYGAPPPTPYGMPSRGPHRGKGPQGYTRTDDRIKESICEALTDDEHLDASHIEVVVKNGDVILTGAVDERRDKRAAEDIAERQSGVKDIQNNLRVGDRGNPSTGSTVTKNETDTPALTSSNDKKPRA